MMYENYKEMKKRHMEEANAFPLGAAFGNKQFKDMMENWGFTENDTDKIVSVGAGCFIRKTDKEAFIEMMNRHNTEQEEAIKADKTGEDFVYSMFYYELHNHEYGYTGDLSDTLTSLGYTEDDINNSPKLLKGLNKAIKKIGGEEW